MCTFDISGIVSLSLFCGAVCGDVVCFRSGFALDVDSLPAVLGDEVDYGFGGDGDELHIQFSVAEPRSSCDIFVWREVV